MDQRLNCDEANKIDLVDYLFTLGFTAKKIAGDQFWYLSPFREERTPSFKVNRKMNAWFDFGEGVGGSLVDFGIRYFNCSISELLYKLKGVSINDFSFRQPLFAGEKKEFVQGRIEVINEGPLIQKALIGYLEARCIPLSIAQEHCRQIGFRLHDKNYTAIGFKNDGGGYELRNPFFKGSSAPKDIRLIDKRSSDLVVFEGFMNYLSFLSIIKNGGRQLPDLPADITSAIVLNSLSFFDKAQEKMKEYKAVNLFLDNDPAGKKYTNHALEKHPHKYKDRSILYAKYKDLNEWLLGDGDGKKRRQRIRRHL